MLRNDVTWLGACLSLGWKPADDDDAEDADAGDDADVRFRLIFLSGTKSKSSTYGRSSPAACPAAQLDVAWPQTIGWKPNTTCHP